MFTSRAEYRLLLRVDNADLRLTPKARAAGLIDDFRWNSYQAREERFTRNLSRACSATVCRDGGRISVERWLRQPAARLAELVGEGFELEQPVGRLDVASVETKLKYQGYLKRQEAEILRRSRDEKRRIPREFPYRQIPGLSAEVVQRLIQVAPETIGQAMRIPGITPAAIAVLSTYVSRHPIGIS
jgi:tRNA uridine 5-carboxymethylaminomethyl modification enzyme